MTLKDLEVVGDYCVLTTREASGELALTAIPLAEPLGRYSVPVSGLAPLVCCGVLPCTCSSLFPLRDIYAFVFVCVSYIPYFK